MPPLSVTVAFFDLFWFFSEWAASDSGEWHGTVTTNLSLRLAVYKTFSFHWCTLKHHFFVCCSTGKLCQMGGSMYQLGLASNMQILTWPARKGLGGWVNSQHHQRKCCAGLIFLHIYIYIYMLHYVEIKEPSLGTRELWLYILSYTYSRLSSHFHSLGRGQKGTSMQCFVDNFHAHQPIYLFFLPGPSPRKGPPRSVWPACRSPRKPAFASLQSQTSCSWNCFRSRCYKSVATFRSLKDWGDGPTYGQPRCIKTSNSHLSGPWLSPSMILGGCW